MVFKKKARIAVAAGTVALAALSGLAPAAHASSGNTTVTFSISSGTLSIAVPASASLGALTLVSPAVGYTGSGSLGTTTVTDARGGVADTVTVTATSSGWTGGTTSNAIPASDGTVTSGVVTFSGGMLAAGGSLTGTNLGGTGQQVLLGVTTGTGQAAYNPTLALTVTAAQGVADSYSGTVTQSAA